MKKKYFKIAVSLFFIATVFNGVAQTDEKPVLARYSSSTAQINKEESSVVPELKRSSVDMTKTNVNSEAPLVTPELKRWDYQPVKKEQPKNSK